MADPNLDVISASSGSTPVAAGGTITFQYPDARAAATYLGTEAPAVLGVRASQAIYRQDLDFTVVFGPTVITVTYLGATPIPANVTVALQLPVRDTSGFPVSGNAYSVPVEVQPSGI